MMCNGASNHYTYYTDFTPKKMDSIFSVVELQRRIKQEVQSGGIIKEKKREKAARQTRASQGKLLHHGFEKKKKIIKHDTRPKKKQHVLLEPVNSRSLSLSLCLVGNLISRSSLTLGARDKKAKAVQIIFHRLIEEADL